MKIRPLIVGVSVVVLAVAAADGIINGTIREVEPWFGLYGVIAGGVAALTAIFAVMTAAPHSKT